MHFLKNNKGEKGNCPDDAGFPVKVATFTCDFQICVVLWNHGKLLLINSKCDPNHFWTWPPLLPAVHKLCVSVTESETEWIIDVRCLLLQPVAHTTTKHLRCDRLRERFISAGMKSGFWYTFIHFNLCSINAYVQPALGPIWPLLIPCLCFL